jgi:hypothetical protein
MTSKTFPDWAVARVDGHRADAYFKKLNEHLKEAERAYRVMHQAYQMTHIHSFRDEAESQAGKVRELKAIISRNYNLYCIVTKGYSLN